MTIEVGKVGMVPIDSIIVSDRARKEMGDLDSAENNMKQIGLTTPLTVKDNFDGTFQLAAGERRLIILRRNGNTSIPVRIYEKELTELELKIIEKSENFYRKDFEFWEYDNLVLEITELEQSVHGTKAPGPGQTGHSLSDTGNMLGVSKSVVSESIKRAEARRALPELFEGCKTASDASKLLKKVDEAMIKQAIAQKLRTEGVSGSTLSQLSKCFIIKSFFEGVKEIPSSIMHFVEIDPPYAIDLHNAKKTEGESQYSLGEYNEIPVEYYMNGDPEHKWLGMNEMFKQCYRVMTDHSWLICWFAPEPWFNTIYEAIINAGFLTVRMCGIWTKPYGQSKRPEMHLSNQYEMFFYAWKGRPAMNKPGRSNIFEFSPVSSQKKSVPTERPIELTTEIYDTFAFPGSRVLIPCLGSGNGLISAHKLGMSGVGFELSSRNKDSFLIKVNEMK